MRPTARPEPFNVDELRPLPLARYLMFARRAWNASQLLQEEISR